MNDKEFSNVKAMHGVVIKGQADPRIVNMLEMLLEEAKNGDIRALAYAAHDGDDLVSYGCEPGTFHHKLITSIALLHHKVLSLGSE